MNRLYKEFVVYNDRKLFFKIVVKFLSSVIVRKKQCIRKFMTKCLFGLFVHGLI